MKKLAWLLLVVMTFAATACGTKDLRPDGGDDPLAKLDLPGKDMTRFTLSNGLEVLVVERHTVPIVTILAAVKNGALAESPEYDGLSHLYEHMFFKGNAVLPDQSAYLARTRELGMSFNAFTSTEAVQYFFTLPAENLEDGLVFMRDALVSPLFSEQELQREIKTVLAEYDRNESSPYFYLHQATMAALFPDFTSRKNVIGDRKIIETATREKMLTIKNRYYVPNNTLLIVAGDVDPATIKPMLEEHYLAWPKAPNPYDLNPVPEHTPLAADKTVVVEQPFGNALVSLSWQGPSVDKDRKATYAADVFSFILQQSGSRFYDTLVNRGIVQFADFSYFSQRHVGPIQFVGLTTPESAGQAIAAMRAEVQRMVEPDYFSDEELQNAKLMLAIDSIYEWQRGTKIAQSLGFWWCVADLDYKMTYIDEIAKVTREDIGDYLKTYVLDKPQVLALLVSPETAARLRAEGVLEAAPRPADPETGPSDMSQTDVDAADGEEVAQ